MSKNFLRILFIVSTILLLIPSFNTYSNDGEFVGGIESSTGHSLHYIVILNSTNPELAFELFQNYIATNVNHFGASLSIEEMKETWNNLLRLNMQAVQHYEPKYSKILLLTSLAASTLAAIFDYQQILNFLLVYNVTREVYIRKFKKGSKYLTHLNIEKKQSIIQNMIETLLILRRDASPRELQELSSISRIEDPQVRKILALETSSGTRKIIKSRSICNSLLIK